MKIATGFLATKERKNYYLFTARRDKRDTGYSYLDVLSDSDVARLRPYKDRYGNACISQLGELPDPPFAIPNYGDGWETIFIDIDKVYHRYDVVLHELHSDFHTYSTKTKVTLSDDQYARLIAWHLYDEHFTMNRLRHLDRRLYDAVICETDRYYRNHFGGMATDPYLVTFDEAKADSELILG